MNTLAPYTVLYRGKEQPLADAPLAFTCMAEDSDHAEEQCENAYPGCEILWLVEGHNLEVAYHDYYYSGETNE